MSKKSPNTPRDDPGVGILIVAHDGLAQAFLATVEHVMGPVARIRALGVRDSDSNPVDRIVRAARDLDAGSGVVIANDMHGSSPGNLAAEAAREVGIGIEVVSGASLPMLVALVENRACTPADAARAALEQVARMPPRAAAARRTRMAPAVEIPLRIRNRKGLHARASARLTEVAEEFESSVFVSRDGFEADGRSILDLLMLAASRGSSIQVRAEGADAEAAVAAIAALVESGFGETD